MAIDVYQVLKSFSEKDLDEDLQHRLAQADTEANTKAQTFLDSQPAEDILEAARLFSLEHKINTTKELGQEEHVIMRKTISAHRERLLDERFGGDVFKFNDWQLSFSSSAVKKELISRFASYDFMAE